MNFDPSIVPFSHAGAWTALSSRRAGDASVLWLRCLAGRRMWQEDGVLRIEAVGQDGIIPGGEIQAEPGQLIQHCGAASIEATWDGAISLRVRVRGGGLRLTNAAPFDGSSLAFPSGDASWRLQMGGMPHFGLTVLQGVGRQTGPRLRVNHMDASRLDDRTIQMVLDIAPEAGVAEVVIDNHLSSWLPQKNHPSFEACVTATRAAWLAWRDAGGAIPAAWAEARDLASYLSWSCQVAPRGRLRHMTTLSSKNHMHAIWSWDTAFFAAAMARHSPDLAWEHLEAWFDHLDIDGALPNIITDMDEMWGFACPQLFGWAVRELIARAPAAATTERLASAYEALSRMTDWFARFRASKGLLEYHHCNDSGQDNASCFDIGMPVHSPDLAAYLVLQMDVLADLAKRLNLSAAAVAWSARADALLKAMVERLWDGRRFVVRRVDDGLSNPTSCSALVYMPLVLGYRLPPAVRDGLIADLRRPGGQIGPHGLMSEHSKSPHYVPDGYWRGPVWSPPTLLVATGLAELGEKELARAIASRWAGCCARHGFAENFNAITGAPQRDRAMPWASAVWLLLVEAGLAAPEYL